VAVVRVVAHDEVLRWTGYPVLARMTFGDALAVYADMRDEAERLRWPWQARRRHSLRADAEFLFEHAFADTDDDAASHATVYVYPQYERVFTDAWWRIVDRRRRFWRVMGPGDFAPGDYAKLRARAERADEYAEDFRRRLAAARARLDRVGFEGGRRVLPDEPDDG